MRIAMLSDIHGNVVALEACLADLERQGGADNIVAAGDLCLDGPRPTRALRRLHEIGAHCIRGNTDRYLVSESLDGLAEGERAQLIWTREQLGERWLAWLRELPESLRFGEGEEELLVVHANPTNDEEHLWPDADDATLERLIGTEAARTIAFGHLHLPYVRLWRNRLLVNVASVGIPKDGDPRASYALFTQRSGGWEIKHRRVEFDVKRVCRQLRESTIPGSEALIAGLRRHRYKRIAGVVP